MKVNSKYLYDVITKLKGKAKVNVYCDDVFTGTTIYWNGEMFIWEPGTFNSEAFFNPKYDFEIIEKKRIEKLNVNNFHNKQLYLAEKINELIEEVIKLKGER